MRTFSKAYGLAALRVGFGVAHARVAEALRNSITAVAIDDATGATVGLARVVTDRATFAWLCDVFVDERFRGQGISKRMLEELERHPSLAGVRRWCLATRDAQGAEGAPPPPLVSSGEEEAEAVAPSKRCRATPTEGAASAAGAAAAAAAAAARSFAASSASRLCRLRSCAGAAAAAAAAGVRLSARGKSAAVPPSHAHQRRSSAPRACACGWGGVGWGQRAPRLRCAARPAHTHMKGSPKGSYA
jgi:GNAT superfamily N-acetyltransferase